jgi:hypothetical protein
LIRAEAQMRFPTAKEGTRVPEDKGRPRGPQLPRWLFLSPEERERSPIWRKLRALNEGAAHVQKYFTPEQLERLRAMRLQLPSHVVELGQRWRGCWEEQAQAAQAAEQPSDQPAEQLLESVEQSARPGRPRIELPHLDAALDALGKKWSKARSPHSPITKRHIKFVGDYCCDNGDEIGRIYGADGGVINEALEKAIRRRIEDWKKPPM